MTTFFLDLWYDLREKRLWPIALLLVIAAAAVPVLLLKAPAEEAVVAPPPVVPTEKAAIDLPTTSVQDEVLAGSNLEVFDPKDPFKPLADLSKEAGDKPAPSQADNAGDDASGGGASGGPSAGSASAGGGSSTADQPSSGGGGGGSTGGAPSPDPGPAPTPQPKEEVAYTYQVDLRFGERGNPRLRRDVQRLQPLPNERTPLLVFLGVSPSTDSAIFLLNSDLSQNGEGMCESSKENCTFLYLRDDPEFDRHFFFDPETKRRYELQLLDIERISVDEAAKASKARRSARKASASVGPKARPFHMPLFGDELE